MQHNENPYSLYKFFRKHVSDWCQKKQLHYTISKHPWTVFSRNLESKCLYIPVYIGKKGKFLFQRRRRLCLVWNCIISLRWLTICGLVKYFKIFHVNWSCWKFNYFSTLLIALRHWKLLCNLDLKISHKKSLSLNIK